jgi:hypothetical protein
MNAFRGATVHSFLNFIWVGTTLVNHDSVALLVIQFEYLRADFLAGTAGDALGVDNIGYPHFSHGILLV